MSGLKLAEGEECEVADEEDDPECKGAACLFFLLIAAVGVSYGFINQYTFYYAQVPATCVEGRLLGQPFNIAQFGVDDTARDQDNQNVAYLACKFFVEVYRCPNDNAEGCLHAILPDAKPMPQRTRAEGNILKCLLQKNLEIGSDLCTAKTWDCATGPCTGYEKAARLCAPKMREDPYPCYFELGDPDSGVRDGAVGFPYGWLLGAIVAAITMCVSIPLLAKYVHDHMGSLRSGFAKLAGVTCCAAVFFGLIVIALYAVGCVAEPKGVVLFSVSNLTVSTASNASGLEINGNSIIPEEEQVETWPLWKQVLVCIGIVVAAMCCSCCCVACLLSCSSSGSALTSPRSAMVSPRSSHAELSEQSFEESE